MIGSLTLIVIIIKQKENKMTNREKMTRTSRIKSIELTDSNNYTYKCEECESTNDNIVSNFNECKEELHAFAQTIRAGIVDDVIKAKNGKSYEFDIVPHGTISNEIHGDNMVTSVKWTGWSLMIKDDMFKYNSPIVEHHSDSTIEDILKAVPELCTKLAEEGLEQKIVPFNHGVKTMIIGPDDVDKIVEIITFAFNTMNEINIDEIDNWIKNNNISKIAIKAIKKFIKVVHKVGLINSDEKSELIEYANVIKYNESVTDEYIIKFTNRLIPIAMYIVQLSEDEED